MKTSMIIFYITNSFLIGALVTINALLWSGML